MSHTGAYPCGSLDDFHFIMLFKCKYSIVFVWMGHKCLCHLGSLWLLQTCCFSPQFPFPLTGAASHYSGGFTTDTVCVGVTSSFPSVLAYFSVVPKKFKVLDHFCVDFRFVCMCVFYLWSLSSVPPEWNPCSRFWSWALFCPSGAKRRSSSLNRLPSNGPQACKEAHKQPQVEKTGAKLPVLFLF